MKKPTLADFSSPNSKHANRLESAQIDDSEPDDLDPFSPENLRINVDLLKGGAVRKLITTIPVRKPKKQEFVRVHPEPQYRLQAALVEVEVDRETYIVSLVAFVELRPTEYYLTNRFVGITLQEVLFIWPVKVPEPDGRKNDWHISGQIAAEHAMKDWVNVTANMSLGAYVTSLPASKHPEPHWPDLSLQEMLKIAFRDRIIDSPEHLAIKKLRGAL